MESAPVDSSSIVVLVLGPLSVAALVGALVWWFTHRKPPNGGPPQR